MKKILFIVAAVLSFGVLPAQVDRTKAPKPAAAREIKIGEYQTFTLPNGLQVFVVENHKLPRIQFSLQLKNDPILEKEKAGFVEITGELIGTGTTTKTKAQLDEAVDYIGANLNTSWNGIFASSLTKHRDKLLELMTDVLYNPSMTQAEMEKIRTQTLSGLASQKDDPNAIIGNVRNALMYGKNHTYGEISTEKTVAAFTLDDCKNFYNTYFKPNNAYLVIVGDIDFKTAKTATEKYFASWRNGAVTNPSYAMPQSPSKTFVAMVDRPNSVQSVISVCYPVQLKPGTDDAIKARVLNQILGGSFSSRLNLNLREKHGFTYGSTSNLNADFLVGSFTAGASVRNEVTDSSVYQIVSELKKISSEPVTAGELATAKAYIAGAFGRSLENPQTIASFAVNTAKYNLPKEYYNNYVKNIDAVTIADVQSTASKYIKPDNAYIVVVGKGSDIADKLKQFGEVKYFDVYGEPASAAKTPLPAGLTAEKVIATYIDAIGGMKKVSEVKSLKMTMTGSIQGQTLTLTASMKSPNKSITEVGSGPMVFQKVVSDGKKVVSLQMGQPQPLGEAESEKYLVDGAIFKELVYKDFGVKATLTGIEKVDDREAYVIEYVLSKGSKSTEYYDKETGLRIQSVVMEKGPQGEVAVTTKLGDYKEVNGVKFPHTMGQTLGPMNLKFSATSIEVNPALDDAIFKVQ